MGVTVAHLLQLSIQLQRSTLSVDLVIQNAGGVQNQFRIVLNAMIGFLIFKMLWEYPYAYPVFLLAKCVHRKLAVHPVSLDSIFQEIHALNAMNSVKPAMEAVIRTV